jgi:hypothetical protein
MAPSIPGRARAALAGQEVPSPPPRSAAGIGPTTARLRLGPSRERRIEGPTWPRSHLADNDKTRLPTPIYLTSIHGRCRPTGAATGVDGTPFVTLGDVFRVWWLAVQVRVVPVYAGYHRR